MFGLLPGLDTLLTLPSIFIFILPSALSFYSLQTYLNLFLFTLSWSTLVLSHHPLAIEFYSVLFVRVAFFLAPSTLFLLFDLLVPSISISIKSKGRRSLPAAAFGYSASSNGSTKNIAFLISVAVLNTLLSTVLQTALDYTLTTLTPFKSAIRIHVLPPTPWVIAKNLTQSYLTRGILSYYIHRYLLHDPPKFPQGRGARASRATGILAKLHNTWTHSLTTAAPFSAAYDHPLAYILHRWLPVYLSAFMFRFHLLSYLLFLGLVSLEEAFSFSGYTLLPSKILLAGVARRQEAHLESGGKGNFGPWGVLDWAHDTVVGERDVVDDLRVEAEKRDVQGKARDGYGVVREGARGVAQKAQDALDGQVGGRLSRNSRRRGRSEDDGE